MRLQKTWIRAKQANLRKIFQVASPRTGLSLMMVQSTRVSGFSTQRMARESLFTLMALDMKESSSMIFQMVRVCSLLQLEDTKANGKMESVMDLERRHGLLQETCTKETM